jgi:hypothetical protein
MRFGVTHSGHREQFAADLDGDKGAREDQPVLSERLGSAAARTTPASSVSMTTGCTTGHPGSNKFVLQVVTTQSRHTANSKISVWNVGR